jgi:hypothetical protein
MLELVLPVLLSTLSSAQAPVLAGQRVRITSARYDLRRQGGQVLSVNAESVTVRFERARTVDHRKVMSVDTLALLNGAVDRWEVSRGAVRRTRAGAFIGLGVGTVVGWYVGTSTYEECVPESFLAFNCVLTFGSAEVQGLAGAMAFGLIGAGVGGLVGSLIRSERWEELPRAPAAVALRSLPDGRLGVGVRLSF